MRRIVKEESAGGRVGNERRVGRVVWERVRDRPCGKKFSSVDQGNEK